MTPEEFKAAIKEYLKEHLRVEVNVNTHFGPYHSVDVSLFLDGEEISQSGSTLPG